MGRKSSKKKQIRRQKYIKKKQETNISFQKKLVLSIEKIARYISMVIYVIVCFFVLGVFYQIEIRPEFLEDILQGIAFLVPFGMFFVVFDKVWPSRESEKDKKRKRKKKRSSYSSSSSSGFVNYSDNDCSSASDSGGGDCGGGGD
ncbi:hypothetical protein [Bacillus pseudomycoides]|uniref:hypothetical protein n=1 Tax=Bacillus pseudomycoides TaxID=64104 RepID=UPI000BEC8037|nr:hypothetical protein [Bacillus pseudomycoides]PEB40578.1 hypothetical protein COO06_17265 [Bacillus pseudomycoides]PGE02226.1 hypothetical protein COM50_04115 [Bacillus pseudomycoides]PGE04534.1 hypothetical protein COM49_08450 [Bacillus pseudomycoides]PHE66466.1 hypothetical protein COF69_19170 [Bacillus pseudomycoides]PHG25492.1 hypothetical protein COI47_06055 [Bacillus pseudomycoides]